VPVLCAALRLQSAHRKTFGQRFSDGCTRSGSRLNVAFRIKPRESDVYREPRNSQIGGQLARGGKAGRVVVESCRNQLIANLAVKLFMKRFVRSESEPKSFRKPRSNDDDAASSMTFPRDPFLDSIVLIKRTAGNRKVSSNWHCHFALTGPLTLYHEARSF
jgi:hypothetical protein